MQTVITSAGTSRRQVPALFKDVAKLGGWRAGAINLDVGGGKFDDGTAYLASLGVTNLVYDPYNRSAEHNARVLAQADALPLATVTCSNVLNVIREPEARSKVIELCARYAHWAATPVLAYFGVYYEPGKQPGPTRDGWQEHRPLKTYASEIEAHFNHVEVRGKLIRAWII